MPTIETPTPKPASHEGALGMLRAMQCTDGAFGTCMMCGGRVADVNSPDDLPVHKPGCVLKAALDAGPSFDLPQWMTTLLLTSTRLYGGGSLQLTVLGNIDREGEVLRNSLANPAGPWVRMAMLALEGAMRSGLSPEDVIEMMVTELGNKISALYTGRRVLASHEEIG